MKPGESFWTLEGGLVHIELCKGEEGHTWNGAFADHTVSVKNVEEEKKRLMLERFQAEHPGFDFSGADFSGQVPDPRTFLRN